jgi:hypothetical protein
MIYGGWSEDVTSTVIGQPAATSRKLAVAVQFPPAETVTVYVPSPSPVISSVVAPFDHK